MSFMPASGAYVLPTPPVVQTDDMTLLYDNIASGAIASWDVNGISQAYNHLQFILMARGDTANPATSINIRFNNDSGNNYYNESVIAGSTGNAGTLETLNASLIRIGACPAATGLSGSAGIITAFIPNYTSTTFNKAISSTGGRVDALSTGNLVNEIEFGMWNNTAALTRMTITPGAGNFVTGSRLSIYGIL